MAKNCIIYVPTATRGNTQATLLELSAEQNGKSNKQRNGLHLPDGQDLTSTAELLQLKPTELERLLSYETANYLDFRDFALFKAAIEVIGLLRNNCDWLKTPTLSIYQHYKKDAWIEQQTLKAPKIEGRVTDAKSAKLGLALGLLIGGTQSGIQRFFATGDLQKTPGKKEIKIKPVAGLDEKFQQVLHCVKNIRQEQQTKGLAIEELFFFTPKTTHDESGQLVSDVYAKEIAMLAQYQVTVKSYPILQDAATAAEITATRTRFRPTEWIAYVAILMLIPAVIGYSFYVGSHHQPISLRFMPTDFGRAPLRIIQGNRQWVPLCRPNQGCVADVNDQGIIVPIKVSGGKPYHIVAVTIAQHIDKDSKSHFRIKHKQTCGDANLSADWCTSYPLNKTKEANAVVVLAQRMGFNKVALQKRLDAYASEAKGCLLKNVGGGAKDIEKCENNTTIAVESMADFVATLASVSVAETFATVQEKGQ